MVTANIAASQQPQGLPQNVLPQIQSYFHAENEDFSTPFTEYSYRDEGFKVKPHLMESPVAFQSILETKSESRGSWK